MATTSDLAPSSRVSLVTAISAAVGLVVWIVAEATGLVVPPEVVGSLSLVAVGVFALFTASAKATAGAFASAVVVVVTWALGQAGIELTVAATGYLNTVLLFVLSWVASEFPDDGLDAGT